MQSTHAIHAHLQNIPMYIQKHIHTRGARTHANIHTCTPTKHTYIHSETHAHMRNTHTHTQNIHTHAYIHTYTQLPDMTGSPKSKSRGSFRSRPGTAVDLQALAVQLGLEEPAQREKRIRQVYGCIHVCVCTA